MAPTGEDSTNMYLEQKPFMRDHRGLSEGAEALRASASKSEPVCWGKVDCLCTVEAHVEAAMVCVGEGDHKLPLLLRGTVDWHPKLVQDPG